MKVKTMIAIAVLTAAAMPASAEIPPSSEREGALMLYFSKSLGHSRSRPAPLEFGLRLDQVTTSQSRTLVTMVDARLSMRGRSTLAAMGMPLFDSALPGKRWFASFESGSGRIPTIGKVGLGALAAAAAACLAQWNLCESGDSDDSDDEYTPPTGG